MYTANSAVSTILPDLYGARNIAAAKVVGTALVASLADLLKDFEVALVTVVGEGRVRVVVQAQGDRALCPVCDQPSQRRHSHYWRTIADVTALGMHLDLRVQARRFRCVNPQCPRKIFAERLPDIPVWARRSDRVTTLLAYIALLDGGLPGKRIASLFGLGYSRYTLLRAARQLPFGEVQPVRVLGVDDFSYRRGVRFGTLLYDFDRQQVIDLLPERSAAFLAAWLKAHPGVKVISRDRGGEYAVGSRQGAPEAIQVADRFHLMQNLGDCLEKIAQRVGIRLPVESTPLPDQTQAPADCPKARLSAREIAKAATRQRRQERQNAIRGLQRQGASISTIAATLKLSPTTVYRYLQRLPDNARPPQRKGLDKYADYLKHRWDEGIRNASTLFTELRSQGYTGSAMSVRRYVSSWRTADPPRRPLQGPTNETVSPRAFRRLVLKKAPSPEEAQLLARITQSNPQFETAVRFANDFAQAIRQHQLPLLTAALENATYAGIPECKSFADSIRKDLDAVTNGVTLPWSQGRVEGSINRLKAIKRAMYGRGKHDLLRRRVLFHFKP